MCCLMALIGFMEVQNIISPAINYLCWTQSGMHCTVGNVYWQTVVVSPPLGPANNAFSVVLDLYGVGSV